jgi:hypothetical protein
MIQAARLEFGDEEQPSSDMRRSKPPGASVTQEPRRPRNGPQVANSKVSGPFMRTYVRVDQGWFLRAFPASA